MLRRAPMLRCQTIRHSANNAYRGQLASAFLQYFVDLSLNTFLFVFLVTIVFSNNIYPLCHFFDGCTVSILSRSCAGASHDRSCADELFCLKKEQKIGVELFLVRFGETVRCACVDL